MSRITSTAFFTLAAVTMTFVHGYRQGAPESACDSMLPLHDVDAQSGTSTYTITPSSTNYTCGNNVTVTLGGVDAFKGFFCQARTNVNTGSSRVGTFDIGVRSDVKKLCNNQGVTHNSNSTKSSMMFTWKPTQNHGNVYIVCTFVKEQITFWTKQPSAMLAYQEGGNCDNGGNGAGHVTSGMLLSMLSFFTYIFCFLCFY